MFAYPEDQYQDFGRFRIGRVLRSVVRAPIQIVKKAVSAVPIIGKPLVKVTSSVLTPIAKEAGKIAQVAAPLVGGVMFLPVMLGTKLLAKKGTSSSGEPLYQDADGRPITKAQYDALLAQAQASTGTTPTTGATTYKDSQGNIITKEQYDALMAQYNAMQVPTTQAPAAPQPYTGGAYAPNGGFAPSGPQVTTAQAVEAGAPVIYKDEYGRIVNQAGYPIDENGKVIPLNQMPEYRETVKAEITRIKAAQK